LRLLLLLLLFVHRRRLSPCDDSKISLYPLPILFPPMGGLGYSALMLLALTLRQLRLCQEISSFWSLALDYC
jgi:hypothetical protein